MKSNTKLVYVLHITHKTSSIMARLCQRKVNNAWRQGQHKTNAKTQNIVWNLYVVNHFKYPILVNSI